MTIKDPFNYIVDRGAARYTNEIVLNTSKKIFSSNELKDYQIGGQVLCVIS